jgi:hypothetical protein
MSSATTFRQALLDFQRRKAVLAVTTLAESPSSELSGTVESVDADFFVLNVNARSTLIRYEAVASIQVIPDDEQVAGNDVDVSDVA